MLFKYNFNCNLSMIAKSLENEKLNIHILKIKNTKKFHLPRGALINKYCGSTLNAPTFPVMRASFNAFSAAALVSIGFNDLPLISFLSKIRSMRAITPFCSLSLDIINKTLNNIFRIKLYILLDNALL